MKILVCGDPHIKPGELEEGQRLIALLLKLRDEQAPDYILFTGDLFHNHSLMHVEVMHFWRKALAKLADTTKVLVLLGNHDGPHDMQLGIHALASLEQGGVHVIDAPLVLEGMLFMPFLRSNEAFIARAQRSPERTMYCHQEFNGCKYDNGFDPTVKGLYAPTGVDPALCPQAMIISGHIHTGQEFANVWYVGAPRWMTVSDANQDRFVWLIEHDQAGNVVGRQAFATDPECQRLVHLEDCPASPQDPATMKPEWKVSVDIRGPADWLEERKVLWRGKARIRTVLVGGKRTQVRESEGIGMAFTKFMQGFVPKHRTAPERLASMAKERLTFS